MGAVEFLLLLLLELLLTHTKPKMYIKIIIHILNHNFDMNNVPNQ